MLGGISELKMEVEAAGVQYLAEYFSTINPIESRIRTRYTHRDQWVAEYQEVCRQYSDFIGVEFEKTLNKKLFRVRALKSQKDKVGPCTFEKGKTRGYLSHPVYERFRLLHFLQGIRIKVLGGGAEPIPNSILLLLCDRIFEQISDDKLNRDDLTKWLAEM